MSKQIPLNNKSLSFKKNEVDCLLKTDRNGLILLKTYFNNKESIENFLEINDNILCIYDNDNNSLFEKLNIESAIYEEINIEGEQIFLVNAFHIGNDEIVFQISDVTNISLAEKLISSCLQGAENSAMAMVITDEKANIIWANKAWSKMTGFTIEEAIGKNPAQLVKSGKMSNKFYDMLWATIESGKPWTGRITNKKKNGNFYTEEMTITPFIDVNDGHKYFHAVKEDVSLNIKLSNSIKKEKSSQLFETAASIMVILDKNGIIEDINLRGANLLGYSREELIGINWFDKVFPDKSREKIKKWFEKLIIGESILNESYTNEIFTKQGNSLYIAWYNQFLTEREGNITAALGSGIDVTNQVKNAKKLERQNNLIHINSDINAICHNSLDVHTLAYEIVKRLSEDAFAKHAWMMVFDYEKNKSYIRSSNDFQDEIIEHHENALVDKNVLFSECYIKKDGYYYLNVERSKKCEECILRGVDPLGKVIGNDLIYEDRVYGSLIITLHENIDLSADELEIFNSIFDKISLSLRNSYLNNKRRSAESEVLEGAKKFETIINCSHEAITIINDDYKFEYVNPAAEKLFETPKEKMVGYNFQNYLAEENMQMVTERYKLRQQGVDVPEKYEVIIMSSEGRKKICNMNSQIITIDGKIKTVNLLSDITEKKYAIEKLKKSEEKYRRFFDLDLTGDYISTVDGRIIDCNTAFIKLMGFKNKEEVLSFSVDGFYSDNSGRINIIERLKKEKFIENIENIYKTADGNKIDVLENMVALFDDKGELLSIQGYLFDITLLRKNEKKLNKALLKAQESDNLKAAFLANMSHEIRTPMNHILGFTHVLKDDELDTETKNSLLETIEKSGNQLVSLMHDIIEFSKIDSNQFNLDIRRFDLHKLLNSIFVESHFNEKIDNENLCIFCKNDIDKQFFIESDEVQLREVLSNLISNAIKFTDFGEINFGYILHDENIEFFVEDSGIGIRKQYFKTIFDRFRKLEQISLQHSGGTGLGLALSKAIVEHLGGKIFVESEFGKGSKFTFIIPIKTNSQSISNDILINENGQKIYKSMKKIKILIAEDDTSNFQLLQILLKPFEAEIFRACDGAEAIEIAKKNNELDLILMDLKMPHVDGFVASQQIKTFRPELPIIAQTAYALSGDREKALKAGCDFYISKPINHIKLKEVIKLALNIRD